MPAQDPVLCLEETAERSYVGAEESTSTCLHMARQDLDELESIDSSAEGLLTVPAEFVARSGWAKVTLMPGRAKAALMKTVMSQRHDGQ